MYTQSQYPVLATPWHSEYVGTDTAPLVHKSLDQRDLCQSMRDKIKNNYATSLDLHAIIFKNKISL